MRINDVVKDVHQNAVSKGWWESERSLSEVIVLAHSELSEAIEASRDSLPPVCFIDNVIGDESNAFIVTGDNQVPDGNVIRFKPEGVAVELADCMIRIMDYFGKQGWDLEQVLQLKMAYNSTRAHKHGGKAF